MSPQTPAPAKTREELILSLRHKVTFLVRLAKATVPASVEAEDLRAVAWIAAIRSVDRLDVNRGSLETLAEHRIRGAISDHLRKQDPLSRIERREVKAGVCANVKRVAVAEWIRDEFAEAFAKRFSAAWTVAALLRRAPLLRKERQIIEMLYVEDMSNVEVARHFGVTEGRISQLHHRALAKLRAAADPRRTRAAAA